MNKAGQSIEARWKSDVSGSEEGRKRDRRVSGDRCKRVRRDYHTDMVFEDNADDSNMGQMPALYLTAE